MYGILLILTYQVNLAADLGGVGCILLPVLPVHHTTRGVVSCDAWRDACHWVALKLTPFATARARAADALSQAFCQGRYSPLTEQAPKNPPWPFQKV